MKKPDETKTTKTDNPKTGVAAQADKPDASAAPEFSKPEGVARKQAAKPGTVKARETGKGEGTSAVASGAEVQPAPSSLVGDGSSDIAGATPKADTPSSAKAGPQPKGPLQDVPPEAILRETPAATPTPTQNVTVQRTGLWQLLLGGAGAAAIGAAAALWLWPQPQPTGQVVDADAIRADAVAAAQQAGRETASEAGQQAAAAEIAKFRDELASAAPAQDDSAGEAIAALKLQLDDQAKRIDQLAERPALDPDMAKRVQDLAAQAETLEGQIRAAAEQAQSQITAAQSEAEKMQAAAEETTKRAEAVAAIGSLQAALDRGVAPGEASQTLEGVGLEAPEPLTREVPSLVSLQADFPAASRAALRATLRDESNGGGNVLSNFLRAQTGARSVQPREGDDADAILSRANAEVEKGRIDAALTEMEPLSNAAKIAPVMADWLTRAQTYADAKAALNDLAATSN